MRALAMTISMLAIVWGVTSTAQGAQSSGCKQCQDQQRACMANYSGKTCKTEYDICMKGCQGKK
jgi:hypothetical protein